MWGALAQGINNTTHGLIWDNVSSDRAMNDWRDMSYQNMINTDIQGVLNNANAMNLWNATGLPAQVDMAKEAGLNQNAVML